MKIIISGCQAALVLVPWLLQTTTAMECMCESWWLFVCVCVSVCLYLLFVCLCLCLCFCGCVLPTTTAMECMCESWWLIVCVCMFMHLCLCVSVFLFLFVCYKPPQPWSACGSPDDWLSVFLFLFLCLWKLKAKSSSAGSEIDCYDCNSWEDPRCHDPFNYTHKVQDMPPLKVPIFRSVRISSTYPLGLMIRN